LLPVKKAADKYRAVVTDGRYQLILLGWYAAEIDELDGAIGLGTCELCQGDQHQFG
jgi:hypothetical protein